MLITIKNYDKGVVGIIDQYPQFIAVCNHIKQELKLYDGKPCNNLEFASFEEFEEEMKRRKENEQ